MFRFRLRTTILAGAIALPVIPVWASDFVVIANKANLQAIDKAQVARIYTGMSNSWPDGSPVMPLDQSEASAIRTQFTEAVTGKSMANVQAAWAKLVFTGKSQPPKVVNGDREVKKAVAANKNAIGYINPASVDDSIRVIFK